MNLGKILFKVFCGLASIIYNLTYYQLPKVISWLDKQAGRYSNHG